MKQLPRRALTDVDIKKYAVNLPNFRGVFMRNTLPKSPYQNECGIVNLDSNNGQGTHWVAYFKNKNQKEYFDSFGNLPPPKEIIKYLGKRNLKYNYHQFQKFNEFNCGHLCLKFLYFLAEKESEHAIEFI